MKKLLFCAAMLLLLGLQALPVNAAAAAQPFVRWSVYSAAAGNENALRAAVAALNTTLQNSEGVLAVYGGEDENGVMRYLEIYTDENAFNAAQNNANVKTAAAQALKLAQVHKTLAADAFNLQSKTAGTADKARMALLVIDPAQLDAYKKCLPKKCKAPLQAKKAYWHCLQQQKPHVPTYSTCWSSMPTTTLTAPTLTDRIFRNIIKPYKQWLRIKYLSSISRRQ